MLIPTIQQLALHLRWLRPLLSPHLPNLAISSSIVLPRMIAFLQSLLPNSMIDIDYRLVFLFPDRRPAITKHINSCFSLLFKAIDFIPKRYDKIVVSAATCLEIPVSSIVALTSDQHLNRSANILPISVAYTMEEGNYSCLRPKKRDEMLVHPYLSRKIVRSRKDQAELRY